jgi:molybdate-binding protein
VAVNVGKSLSYQPLSDGGAAGSSWDRADGVFRNGRIELFDDADPSGFVVAGCDPALGLAASLLPRRGPQRLLAIVSSTAAAIEALEDGRVHAAAVHWPGAQSHPTARSVRRYVIARWRVGIATRAGTKLEIDLLASGKIRVAGRELGAEVQRALERLLTSLGQVPHLTGPVATGHLDAARHVAYGSADAAPTMEAAALAYGLEFSPLESHRVEVWIDAEWADHPGAGALLEALTSRALLDRLEALGGYDLSQTGGAA